LQQHVARSPTAILLLSVCECGCMCAMVCTGLPQLNHYNPRMMWLVIIQGSPATLYTTTTLLAVENSTSVSCRIQITTTIIVHFHYVYPVYQGKAVKQPDLFISITHRLIFINCEEVLKIITSYHLKYIFALWKLENDIFQKKHCYIIRFLFLKYVYCKIWPKHLWREEDLWIKFFIW